MYYDDRNLAYDLRLFEHEETRSSVVKTPEKEQEIKPTKKKQNTKADAKSKDEKGSVKRIKRRKNNFLNISLVVVFAAVIMVVVGLIIHGQVQLTELNQQISAAQSDLEEQQSLYTQLKMKVDASISTAVVEKYAQEKLGMSKVSNAQKEFVTLSGGDKAEVSAQGNQNLFSQFIDSVNNLWS